MLSVARTLYCRMLRQLMIDELENMWKEMVVTYLEVRFWWSLGETENKHERPQSGQPVAGRCSNRAVPKYT
jgi:ribosomal protein L29